MRLCRSKSNVCPKPVAFANLLVVSPPLVLNTWTEGIDDTADTRPHLFWDDKRINMSIILFAVEFKGKDVSTNRNRLIMDLSTAQYQRRALGLKREVLFGASSSINGTLQFYASQWGPLHAEGRDTEMIFVYPVGTRYDITQPIPYLKCHFILCNMKDRHLDNLVKDFHVMKGAGIAVAAKQNAWLAPGLLASRSTTTTSATSALEDEDNAHDGHRLTVNALSHHGGADQEVLPLRVWRDVLMYPPQETNQPEP
ncbi:hypothetical protein FRB95_010269 [Tulasnella sp. JGI-2019a]|nr:hypothetical protein FRB95_010269 [Tulasnella sp. JGI-2019a]